MCKVLVTPGDALTVLSAVGDCRYVEVGTMPDSPGSVEPGRMKLRAYMISDRIRGKVLDFEVLLDGCGMACKGDSQGYRDSEYSLVRLPTAPLLQCRSSFHSRCLQAQRSQHWEQDDLTPSSLQRISA